MLTCVWVDVWVFPHFSVLACCVCDFDCFLWYEQPRVGGAIIIILCITVEEVTASWRRFRRLGVEPTALGRMWSAHLSVWPGAPLWSRALADAWTESWPVCWDAASRRALGGLRSHQDLPSDASWCLSACIQAGTAGENGVQGGMVALGRPWRKQPACSQPPLFLPAVFWMPFPTWTTTSASLSVGTQAHCLHPPSMLCQAHGILFHGLASSENSG